MDYSNIVEVREVSLTKEVNNLLASKDEDWILLGIAPGQDVDKSPYVLYSLGKKWRFEDVLPRL